MIGQPLSRLKRQDALLWSLELGRMHSRNNIVVADDLAVLTTSGEHWNKPDNRDGVYCVDLKTGRKVWFSHTESDANEVSLIGNVALVGTDGGKAFAISADTGSTLKAIGLDSPILTKAIELQTSQGRIAILLSKAGDVVQYDIARNKFAVIGTIPFSFRANPVSITANSFLAGSESGFVLRVEIKDERVDWKQVFQVTPHKSSGSYNYDLQIKGISSIVVVEDRAILSYARDTYDRRPPILCFSLKTGQKLWDAGRVKSATKTDDQTFGNARITPARWKNLILSTFSYNESVHAFSLETGKWIWRVRLDDSYFQNWSSPVVDDDRLYVARVNGVLSVIDLNVRKMLSTYSVEVFETANDTGARATFSDASKPWPNSAEGLESKGPWPHQELIAGICSTPAIWKDKILIGTVSGHLRCFQI
jgi:outer membrane protein assembly factor BamB